MSSLTDSTTEAAVAEDADLPSTIEQLDPVEFKAAVLRRWDWLVRRKFLRAFVATGRPVYGGTVSAKEKARRRKQGKAARLARRVNR